jgi:hypothetical protein
MIRPPSNTQACVATPARTDPARNTMSPTMNSRRRPIRSPSRPKSNSKPPNTSAYALSTHCEPLGETPRRALIEGNAMLTIVVSTTAVNDATHNSASACEVFPVPGLAMSPHPPRPDCYPRV